MAKRSVLIGILLLGGIAFSWWDYNRWRHAELDKYGHGFEAAKTFLPAQTLTRPYSNTWARFRIKPPQGWDIKSNPNYDNKQPVPSLPFEVVRFAEPFNKATIVAVVQKTSATPQAVSDAESEGITSAREYVNTDTASSIVLTWETTTDVRQKLYTKNGDILLTIEVTCGLDAWKTYAQTFGAVYRSLVWL